ncbi:putative ABC transporter permease [Candidatus Woesearchaeota archaeon]|nr:putative ABC transporter permease [Candidatus Woesearchaeota archaeon]
MIEYLVFFIVFSFVGWVIDTGYRSAVDRRYAPGSIFPFFAPIYGFGGIILVILFNTSLNPAIHVLIGGIAATTVELVGGMFCVKFLRRRLWDYSKNRWQYRGHIDALHTVCWFIVTAALRMLFPYMQG